MPNENDAESAPLLNHDDEPKHPAWLAWLYREDPLTPLEQLLVALAFIFLCTTAVFAGLFGAQKHINDTRPASPTYTVTHSVSATPSTGTTLPTASPRPPSKNDAVCLTSACVREAASILESLDESVDPCEDFYGFANNGWLANNPVPEDKSFYGAAQQIGKLNERTMAAVLSRPVEASMSEADQTNLKHLQAFYAACLDEDALEKKKAEPLLDLLKPVVKLWRGHDMSASGPWDWLPLPPVHEHLPPADDGKQKPFPRPGKPEPKPDTHRQRRLTETLTYLHSRGVEALWSNAIEGDVGSDPQTLRIWLSQGELGMPDPAYFKAAETVTVYREIVGRTLAQAYKDLGAGPADMASRLERLAREAVVFEKKLAKAMWDAMHSVQVDDPILTYNPHSIIALQNLTGDIVDFRSYFSGFSPRAFPEPVIVATPSYFSNLTDILEEADDDVLEAYFVWKTCLAFGRLLGPQQVVRKEVSRLMSYLGGIDENVKTRREETCLKSVQEHLSGLISRFYIEEAFAGDSRAIAEGVMESIIDSFNERLPELDWLDANTRDKALAKAKAINVQIGYPANPNNSDPVALQRFYAMQEPFDPKDHFGNVLRSILAARKRFWLKVGRKPDIGEWEMPAFEVNAYYNPVGNNIVFPAGILQPPYFSALSPEYTQFGGFGAVAGHELTHAFDKAGRLYDENGKLTNWWSNDTAHRFNELQQCFLDQYSKYYIVGPDGKKQYINARYTIGEDIADSGGLDKAFRAWKKRFDSDANGDMHANHLLPGINYTREQMFFIAYARSWVRNIKPQEALRRILVDPHSPTNFRVLGPLSNSKEFAQAFKCKRGSRYNPEKQCALW